MKKLFRGPLAPCVLVLLVLISLTEGCSSRTAITLNSDMTGYAEVEITLHEALGRYLRNILEFSGGENSGSGETGLFDLEKIKTGINTRKGLSFLSAELPGKNSIKARIAFSDLNAVFPEGLTLKRERSGNLLTVYITRNNYQRILERFFLLASLDAQEDYLWGLLEPASEDTLTDMYDYAFGEYVSPGETITGILARSSIRLSVTFPGKVLSQSGGSAAPGTSSGNTAVFTIPLLAILSLEKPVLLTALFK